MLVGAGGPGGQVEELLPLHLNVCCLTCNQIVMRFCRLTSAAAIAGMARKRGCAAPPP
jgi:hypothetical protein